MANRNSYFTLLFLSLCSFISSQNIQTIAGNGTAGYTGDGGPAISATMDNQMHVAADKKGNVYVADRVNNAIRKISTSGIMSTVAGNGTAGFGGDNGPATSAQLNYASGVAVDKIGNIYIGDEGNHRVRKVDTFGIITTIAGTGVQGYNGDGISATSAQLNNPIGVAIDTSGNIYISDGTYRIRKINTSGIISTICGTGVSGFSGDGGLAINAQLNGAAGIAVDKMGGIYFSDFYNNRIRKINTSGIVNTIAGSGGTGYGGDGGLATSAQIYQPLQVAIDKIGNVFIAGYFSHSVRMINNFGIINTVAGTTGVFGFSGDGGPAINAQMNGVLGVATDTIGNLYISDAGNNRVRKVDNSVGIKQFTNNNNIEVYPNPTSNLISLAGGDISCFQNATIIIQNTLGQTVKKIPFAKIIDVSDLNNGVYFLQIQLPSSEHLKTKFIKL